MLNRLKQGFNHTALALSAFYHAALATRPVLEVYKWCEENIYLSERSTAIPGNYSTELTPYVREPLQCFADKRITDLTLCWGTQTAKTQTIMSGVAYRVANDASPTLWVMPNKDLAQSFSENRWQPLVDDCPRLAAEKPTGAKRNLFKNLEQHFAKCTLAFVGSNSPANLASRPAGLLVMDEVDKFGDGVHSTGDETEAGALQLAEERTKTFPFPLRVKTSTPTTEHGQIWQEFKLGDQRYYFMPCPLEGCGAEIKFEFRDSTGDYRLKWDQEAKNADGSWDEERVRRSAYYECPECKGAIKDHHKPRMLHEGRWKATNPFAPISRRSYHLNSLYAPWKECTFGSIAVKWVQTSGSITRRHNFINSCLAEPWNSERAIDEGQLFTEDYREEFLPAERTPVMSIDCQVAHFWVLIREFARNGESWLRYADKVETIEEIENLQAQYKIENRHVIIDMANDASKVAKIIVDHDWRGAWGSDKKGFTHALSNGARVIRSYSPVQIRDPHLGTKHQSDRNKRAMFVYWSKESIRDTLAIQANAQPAIFHIHSGVPREYIRHRTAHMKTTKVIPGTGKVTQYWRQMSKEDHLDDCECMALVCAMAGEVIEDTEVTMRAKAQCVLPAFDVH